MKAEAPSHLSHSTTGNFGIVVLTHSSLYFPLFLLLKCFLPLGCKLWLVTNFDLCNVFAHRYPPVTEGLEVNVMCLKCWAWQDHWQFCIPFCCLVSHSFISRFVLLGNLKQSLKKMGKATEQDLTCDSVCFFYQLSSTFPKFNQKWSKPFILRDAFLTSTTWFSQLCPINF